MSASRGRPCCDFRVAKLCLSAARVRSVCSVELCRVSPVEHRAPRICSEISSAAAARCSLTFSAQIKRFTFQVSLIIIQKRFICNKALGIPDAMRGRFFEAASPSNQLVRSTFHNGVQKQRKGRKYTWKRHLRDLHVKLEKKRKFRRSSTFLLMPRSK